MAEDVRYSERSTVERVNGGLKDNHGGRTVRVRGAAKVMCPSVRNSGICAAEFCKWLVSKRNRNRCRYQVFWRQAFCLGRCSAGRFGGHRQREIHTMLIRFSPMT